MREITDIEDQMQDRRRFEHDDRCVVLPNHVIELHGLDSSLAAVGFERDHTRLPVFQNGEQIGTLEACWNVSEAVSTLMYQPRETDFRRVGDKWEADNMLGPGDLLHAGVALFNKPDWSI